MLNINECTCNMNIWIYSCNIHGTRIYSSAHLQKWYWKFHNIIKIYDVFWLKIFGKPIDCGEAYRKVLKIKLNVFPLTGGQGPCASWYAPTPLPFSFLGVFVEYLQASIKVSRLKAVTSFTSLGLSQKTHWFLVSVTYYPLWTQRTKSLFI